MPNNSHLTLQDRIYILNGIIQNLPFRQIAAGLNKDPGTISKEIKKHRELNKVGAYGRGYNPCAHRYDCTKTDVCKVCFNPRRKCSFCKECTKHCRDYEEELCPKLSKPPYVCNGCKDRRNCTLSKYDYNPSAADQAYRETLSNSRKGFAVTPEELERLNCIVSPLIKKGQSIHHIYIVIKGID